MSMTSTVLFWECFRRKEENIVYLLVEKSEITFKECKTRQYSYESVLLTTF